MGQFFEPSPDVATNFRKIPAKLAPRCTKSRPRWAKMATRWPSWPQLGRSWSDLGLNLSGFGGSRASTCPVLGGPVADFGSIFDHFGRCVVHPKTLKKRTVFKGFSWCGGPNLGWLGHLGALPVRCWAKLAPRWVQDRQKSPKMGPRSKKNASDGDLGAVLAPSWAQ